MALRPRNQQNVENIVGAPGNKGMGSKPLQTRVALATISDQSNVFKTRLNDQNAKGIESKLGKAKSVTTSFKNFKIYQDDENEAPAPATTVPVLPAPSQSHTELDSTHLSIDGRLVVNSLVKRLPKPDLRDVSCISIDTVSEIESVKDSPMHLDISAIEEEEQDYRAVSKDLFLVPEYASDIYEYLREAELRNRPKAHYMKKQSDITDGMRCILVDWLVEVAEEYKLQTETLYLTVNYIDRFLSYMSVLRGKLQLVGAACMYIASKYEEIYPPDVGEFVYITDDTYTKKQVLKMEALVLRVLTFDLVCPTVYCFLQRYCKVDDADEVTECLALYIAELSLLDADYLPFLVSEVAAAAVCLANHTRGRNPWSARLEVASGYSMRNFYSCMSKLYQSYCSAPSHPQQAIRDKYKNTKFYEVSEIVAPSSMPM